MNKVRTWFNRAKKKQEVENQLMIRPLTPERRHQAPHDVPVIMEMLSSTQRGLDGGLIQSDLTQTTRLSMLRELLQGDASQKQEVSDVQQQHHRTTVCAPLPVWRSRVQEEQVEQEVQVTGDGTQTEPTSDLKSDSGGLTPDTCDIISLTPTGGGATDTGSCDITSVSRPGLPARRFLKTRDACSAPSSPHPGGRRRLPCSLPCSPLLGGRHWRSSDSAPSPPSPLSRLWVEAALQRSRNIRPPAPPSPQVRQEGQVEGGRGRSGGTEEGGEEEEEEEEEEWRDEEEEEDRQVSIFGIRMSDTVIFRPMTSPSTCVGAGEEEGEEGDSGVLCLDSETWRYCLLTPCVCSRCPSAPPYEGQVFSPGNSHTDSALRCKDLTQLCQRTDTQRTDTQRTDTQRTDTQSVPTDSSRLYPSLSQWTITADTQTELNRKQEQEVNSFNSQLHHNTVQFCFHGNTDAHLCETTSGGPGDVQTLCSADLSFILRKVFDSTTCSRTTAHHDESCSFCSDKLSDRVTKHLCNNCHQVFCGRCVSHFVSLSQIHQFSQSAAV